MPDDSARIGVPVFRWSENGFPWRYFPDQPNAADNLAQTEPGLWFASTPEAVAERYARVLAALADPACDVTHCTALLCDCRARTHAAIQALGFTDGD